MCILYIHSSTERSARGAAAGRWACPCSVALADTMICTCDVHCGMTWFAWCDTYDVSHYNTFLDMTYDVLCCDLPLLSFLFTLFGPLLFLSCDVLFLSCPLLLCSWRPWGPSGQVPGCLRSFLQTDNTSDATFVVVFYMGIWLQFYQLYFQKQHGSFHYNISGQRGVQLDNPFCFQSVVGEIVVKFPYECFALSANSVKVFWACKSNRQQPPIYFRAG